MRGWGEHFIRNGGRTMKQMIGLLMMMGLMVGCGSDDSASKDDVFSSGDWKNNVIIATI